MSWYYSLPLLAGYIVTGRWLVGTRRAGRAMAFAVLNIAIVYILLFSPWSKGESIYRYVDPRIFPIYILLIALQYLALLWWGGRSDGLFWLAFIAPLCLLIAFRYIPRLNWGVQLVGFSYCAFRTSYLALEVRNGQAKRPGFWEYVGFAFFVPTMSVGPINPYSEYRRAFDDESAVGIPVTRALLRGLVGAVKFIFFSPLLFQLSYAGLLLDGHPHPILDLPIAAVAYFLFLYCNFSGFCDMAIAAAGLMGIPVAENFDNPFMARNIKDFWNRWHITLSRYMRDVVFSPLSKYLVRVFGAAMANHAIAATIVIVFILVGLWHGVGWNYCLFGLIHAGGVVVNHYYTIGLKKSLGKDRLAAYHRSPWVRAAAVSLTFAYVTGSFFVFANDGRSARSILAMLGVH